MAETSGPRVETYFLPGPAGRLEGFLKRPAERHPSGAAAVVCHPHPLFGGTMHNKVVHASSEALARLGLPVLRFNFRGAGRSQGRHEGGRGEQEDLRAILDEAGQRFPGAALIVAGYSFGAYVGLGVGCLDERVAALIGIAAPIGLYNFGFLQACRKPLFLIQGEADPLAPLGLVMTLAAMLPAGARVLPVAGANHGFDDHLDGVAARVSEAIGWWYR